MAQLLVRDIPDALVNALELRAAAHGVSSEEEHRRILAEQLRGVGQTARYDFKDHLSALSEVEDDVLFERPRSVFNRPPLE
jgi:plasmid stability protein